MSSPGERRFSATSSSRRFGEDLVGLLRVDAVEDAGYAEDQAVTDLGGAAEEVVEDQQRQQLGVVGDQIGLGPGC